MHVHHIDTAETWVRDVIATLTAWNRAPDPTEVEYTRLLQLWQQQSRGGLPPKCSSLLNELPHAVRALRQDPWVQRYLECAELDRTGVGFGGGARGVWISKQRRARASGALPAGQEMLLNQLPGFSWTPEADRWEATFDQVRRFTQTHGRVPSRADDPGLSGWLAAQRLAMRRGRLSARRVEVLQELAGWTHSLSCGRAGSEWDRTVSQARRFVSTHDRYPDPRACGPEGALARWIETQRGHHRRGDLSRRRAAALAALPNWRWSAREAEFDARVGEIGVVLACGPIGTDHRLYSWIAAQRRRHRDGQLSAEQSAQLDSLNLLNERLPQSI